MDTTIENNERKKYWCYQVFVFVTLLAISSVMAAAETGIDLQLAPWRAVNDGVMGGVSAGEIVAAGEVLRFKGELSLENNGGFASVRRPVDSNFDNVRGLKLHVKGDGRRYQFRLSAKVQFDGVSWRHEFDTDGTLQTVELLFEDFESVFRGDIVHGAGPLKQSNIDQIGFLLADGKPGKFQLDIIAIEFIRR